jgi:hypothetical protein
MNHVEIVNQMLISSIEKMKMDVFENDYLPHEPLYFVFVYPQTVSYVPNVAHVFGFTIHDYSLTIIRR